MEFEWVARRVRWTATGVRAAVLTAILAACAGCASVGGQAEPAGSILIRNVTIVPVDREGSLAGQDVLIRGDRVAAIAPTGTLRALGARRVDGTGKFLIPGLWDMHSHLNVRDDLGPGDDPDPQSVIDRKFRRYLGYGIVGIRDTGSKLPSLLALREALSATSRLPELIATGPLIDGPRQRWTAAVALPTGSPAEARAAAEQLADSGVDQFKVYEALPPSHFEAVMQVARERGVPVVGHIPLDLSSEQVSAAGMIGIEHVYVNLVRTCLAEGGEPQQGVLGAWISGGYEGRNREAHRLYSGRRRDDCRALFGRLAERGTFVTPVLSMELRGRGWTTQEDRDILSPEARTVCDGEVAALDRSPEAVKQASEAAVLEIVRELHQAGVRLLAGTDAPGSCLSFGHSLHRELELLSAAGLAPLDVLRTATLNPARMLGREDEGIVRPGARANLLLLGADPLADVLNSRRIEGLVLDGTWIEPAELEAMRRPPA